MSQCLRWPEFNPELNVIACATKAVIGIYLRKPSEISRNQDGIFLVEHKADSDQYLNVLDWFETLPLWFELACIRVVNVCWDAESIRSINDWYASSELTPAQLQKAGSLGAWEVKALKATLKRKEVPISDDYSLNNCYGKSSVLNVGSAPKQPTEESLTVLKNGLVLLIMKIFVECKFLNKIRMSRPFS